ncbi:MAG: hypothetical protein HRT35_14155 [Algicola sp.]|nr:hypothetical protein [Algicola sp.]
MTDKRLLPALLFIALIFDVLFFANTLEDAQITYRYALRFSEGFDFGMWNRTGSPVEGFTTFLWMVYLSLFGPNLESIVYASKITGILAHLSIIGLFVTLYQRYSNQSQSKLAINLFKGNEAGAAKAFLYSALAVTFFLPLSWYASSGMETLAFIALICLVLFLPLLTINLFALALVTLLLVLIRPDGIMFAFAAPLYYWFISKDKKHFAVMAVAVLAFFGLIAFRYSYFGYVMPNSYYAKSANVEGFRHLIYGIMYFGSFVANYFYLFLPILFASLSILRKKQFAQNSFLPLAFAGITLYFAIVAKAGGDNFSAFPMWRHGLNLFPLIAFCTFYSLHYLWHTNQGVKSSRNLSFASLALLFIVPMVISVPLGNAKFLRTEVIEKVARFPDLSNDYKDNALLLWIKNITDENTVVTTALAGALPLTVDAVHIDVLGLNNEKIAHSGTFDYDGPIDSKSNMQWVIEQKPDIIEGYMNAKKIINNEDLAKVISARQKMNLELLQSEQFKQQYLIITNAPYEAMNRVLFISKSYYQKISNKHDVQVMSVDNLVAAAHE